MEKFKRDSQARWDKRNMRTFSTRLTVKQAMRVRAACTHYHVTPYRLIQDMLLRWVRERETEQSFKPPSIPPSPSENVRFIDFRG